MCLFSISGGYLGTIIMMFAPKVSDLTDANLTNYIIEEYPFQTLPEGEQQATAGSIMVSCLVLGLAAGSVLSRACVLLL